MKIYIVTAILLIFFLTSCSNVKSVYEGKLEIDKNDSSSKLLIKQLKLGEEESIIYFMGTFDNNDVKVIVDEKIILDSKMKTIEQLGVAGSCVIQNNADITIIIDTKKIILDANHVKLYKFIYVKKENMKYIVTYTNKAYSFR
ncbi:hypothetical protein [Chryseobacterium gregarium]|uniref:hypothetical protein n=1 Tax=Chryseobacterium gregarium TaxID=456299 RepID=UPI0004857E1B|nr:hypothetical protein [Chryseobacterium gregarium]